ncbi:hypothetical protein G4G93_11185 [Methylobacterium sp. DB0501]|uniref:hypothetical protein n=1 Tax=Methylobacterium sp. DB0501 TaxID=2709665 RepID=UPI0013EDD163|nr:hypothetical protein [Methylobacterium sp. DB0501]NGM34487.1 hypothetical protein [Methylobacterium sp. DB0501]
MGKNAGGGHGRPLSGAAFRNHRFAAFQRGEKRQERGLGRAAEDEGVGVGQDLRLLGMVLHRLVEACAAHARGQADLHPRRQDFGPARDYAGMRGRRVEPGGERGQAAIAHRATRRSVTHPSARHTSQRPSARRR